MDRTPQGTVQRPEGKKRDKATLRRGRSQDKWYESFCLEQGRKKAHMKGTKSVMGHKGMSR